ncbi:hypothetical protein DFJ58DRAFT_846211 [Suillus subalutaceus]|uniref:uncharacterized protein n=1 Tax=Suillus subalutaceus TaxID=48586 RepID=UPI001B873428|nr:uncharacterized protein DFJ58DRAFT_846211 [Suillus subalutaceus]KAG1838091.1 hypothetical protein DFJ58DRAFT_846211 [Suillus subalutaceus]
MTIAKLLFISWCCLRSTWCAGQQFHRIFNFDLRGSTSIFRISCTFDRHLLVFTIGGYFGLQVTEVSLWEVTIRSLPARFSQRLSLLIDQPTILGHPKDNVFLDKCFTSAKVVIKQMIEVLAPSGLVRTAPDGHFVFVSFASAFMLKLLRPEFAQLLTGTIAYVAVNVDDHQEEGPEDLKFKWYLTDHTTAQSMLLQYVFPFVTVFCSLMVSPQRGIDVMMPMGRVCPTYYVKPATSYCYCHDLELYSSGDTKADLYLLCKAASLISACPAWILQA